MDNCAECLFCGICIPFEQTCFNFDGLCEDFESLEEFYVTGEYVWSKENDDDEENIAWEEMSWHWVEGNCLDVETDDEYSSFDW